MATNKSAEAKTAGQDEPKADAPKQDAKTDEVPTKAEQVENKDNGVETEAVTADQVEAGQGVVSEKDADGNEYEVPWAYLTVEDIDAESVARTSDWDDPARAWNAQEAFERDEDEATGAAPSVQAVPGQTFRVSELPDLDRLREAGIDPAQFLAGLPVRSDVPGEAPRRGTPA